jgi:Concanavalin A-like lectin/glucanases superfamily
MKKSVLQKVMVLSMLWMTISGITHAQIGSMNFQGTGQYVQFENTNPLAGLNGDCTIDVWFYHRGGGPWQRLIGFGGSDRFFALMPNAHPNFGGGIWFAMSNTQEGDQQLLATNTPIALNTWHHLAITIKDNTNTARMYLNGEEVAVNHNVTLRPGHLNGLFHYRFGRSNFLTDPFYNGYIDEIRFSNTVRYTANFTPNKVPYTVDANTTGLWRFDEGMGQMITDASGHNHHGMVGSTPVADGEDPEWSLFNILPIKFHSFSTHKTNDGIKLKWSTSTIENDAEFVVERSFDGTQFQPVATIDVIKNQLKTSFEFDDKTKANGKIFYRIKLQEGTQQSYSRIAVRHMNVNGFKIQQTLVSGNLSIITDDPGQFVISDVLGKTVHKFYLGSSSSSAVNISHLRSGVYFLNNTNGTTLRFIKQ